MGLITNGFPKAGNHALVKACQLLGQPCAVEHIVYADKPEGAFVFIRRDPRNIVLSWLRFQGKPVEPGLFITHFRAFQNASLVEEMAAYEGWLTDPDTLVVRYEDLIASDAEMRRIAAALGVPYLEGAFEALPGLTRTWNAQHANYATFWTPDVEAVWAAEGGPELLERWGYA